MQYKDVSDMIGEMKLPYAYYAFPENTEQATPFVVFWYPQNDGYYADGENYVPIHVLYIELYTDHKDPAIEAQVEQVLRNHDMAWEKGEETIESELMYLVRYQSEVIIDA